VAEFNPNARAPSFLNFAACAIARVAAATPRAKLSAHALLPWPRMDRTPADEELMLAYRAGDAAAFDVLYARHKGAVFRYLRRQTGTSAAAEELFQDVWLRLIDARGSYEPRAKFTTWLFTIAHNRLMDYFRSTARGALVSYDDMTAPVEDVESKVPRPEQSLERKQLATALLAAMDSLPAAQREAFLLQQESGLTLEEIAAVTGVNRETVKSRLRYAVAKLRARLDDAATSKETGFQGI
jgi:RNA polymerase sigma factor (sigma-70 family)